MSGSLVRFVLPSMPNADTYRIDSTCGGGSSISPTVDARLWCTPDHVYVSALGGATGGEVGAFASDNVGSGATQVDLTSESWRAPKTTELTLENLPGDFDETKAYIRVQLPDGGPDLVDGPMFSFTTLGATQQATTQITLPDVPAQDWQLSAPNLCRPGACQTMVMRIAGSTDAVVDAAKQLLPWINQVQLDTAGHAIHWAQTGSAAVDYAVAEVGLGTGAVWFISGPPSDTTLAFPQAAPLPLIDASTQIRDFSLHTDAGGWDAVRNRKSRLQAIGDRSITSMLAP